MNKVQKNYSKISEDKFQRDNMDMVAKRKPK